MSRVTKHPYVIETLNQMLLEEIVLLPNNEAIEKQTDQQTDNLPEVIQSPKEHTFDSSKTEELFEPWSPGFQVAALREEDIVSASFECIQDGEFRKGKKFFCTRCRQYFYGSVNFRLHRETRHPIKERTVEMGSQLPGPSSENVNTSTHPNEADIQSSSQEDASPILQTGAGERPYTIKHTGTRTFSKIAATEYTFKLLPERCAYLEEPVEYDIFKVTGPDNSIRKKRSMVQIINPDQLCMERAIGISRGRIRSRVGYPPGCTWATQSYHQEIVRRQLATVRQKEGRVATYAFPYRGAQEDSNNIAYCTDSQHGIFSKG
ncbi:hypothetical protein ACF0H5_014325 [Mactra antiquata]